jgi:hypothetical protein
MIALTQGQGEESECQNVTVTEAIFKNSSMTIYENRSELQPISLEPIFSVSVYFIFILLITILCAVSFTLLNTLSSIKNVKTSIRKTKELNLNSEKKLLEKTTSTGQEITHDTESAEETEKNDRFEQYYLYCINFAVTFVLYGILPGMQSYSTLPYGY